MTRVLAVVLVLLLAGCGDKPVAVNPAPVNPVVPAPAVGVSDEPGPNFSAVLPAPSSPVADGLWSNPATWGGIVPKDGAYVLIPEGRVVRLNTDTAFLAGLRIQGTLVFDDSQNLKLASRFVLVDNGLLQIGTEEIPFSHKAIITLTGTDETINVIGEAPMKMGTKFIGTNMGSGRLEIHGARRAALSWSQLEVSAAVGATSMTLKDDASSWRVGDEIVLASSSFDPTEAERLTITAVAGKTVSFAPALKFAHWGTLQTFEGKTVDQRAEVGLLTRDIVIQGASDSAASSFGGHAMMMGAVARVEGVEFRNMGQAGIAGRYSFHWHFAGNKPNDYFKNNSVHNSFQRAVVVHRTNQVLVENNVAYNVFNHMYVPSEDGNEEGSRFIRNLGVLSKSPLEKDFAFRVDNTLFGNSTQGEFRSSVFWGRNFGGTFIGNHAAGAQNGNGFFFDSFNSITEPADNGALRFEDNVAHSIYRGETGGVNAETYPEATLGHGIMFGGENMGDTLRSVVRSTVYKSFGGFWAEDRSFTVKDSIAADNGAGVFILRSVLDDVLIVSQTANTAGNRPRAGDAFVRGAIVAPPSHGMSRAPVVKDVTVVNEADTAIHYNRHEANQGAIIERLKLVNTNRAMKLYTAPIFEYYFDETMLPDPNGTVLNNGQAVYWVHQRALLFDDACTWHSALNAGSCPLQNGLQVTVPNVGRSDPRPIAFATENGRANALSDPFAGELSRAVLGNNNRYLVNWNENNPGSSLELLFESTASKNVQLVLAASGAPTQISLNNLVLPSVSSVVQLNSSSGYFFDASRQRLYVGIIGDATAQRLKIIAPFTSTFLGRSANSSSTVQGLNYQYFEGNFAAPRIQLSGTPIKSGTVTDLELNMRNRDTNLGVVFNGFLNIPTTGFYQLASSADGSADIRIGGERIVSEVEGVNYVGVGAHEVALVALQQGLHPIQIVYSFRTQGSVTPDMNMLWKKVITPAPELDYELIPASAFRR